jgi:uroporphyrinogen decarboxylase
MTNRQLIRSLIRGEAVPRCGFWLGNPHPDSWPRLHAFFGTTEEEELRRLLRDDFRWLTPQYMQSTYRHPEGKGIFDLWRRKRSHGEPGPLSGCENARELDDFDWPDPAYLNFDEGLRALEHAGDHYRASGFWTPFFHDLMDLFGMEQYFVAMRTHPGVIRAATDRVCGFYYEANDRFYRKAGNAMDGFFFGNDFGTQRDLMMAPEQFEEFILPWFRRFTEQAHGHGYQVILHSCGSIYRVIGTLIEAGVDCLHPLQASAKNMDAQSLAEKCKGKLAFMGGVDTQHLLVNGTPQDVQREVRRLRGVLGPRLIVSPSHEALLPDVPPENIRAMAEAALE